ncbi:MAG: transcription termination factor Rho [Planctomycetes bacterium]|nr:transcription termination factor Rho [Planctomycetota bacterium]
MAENGSNSLNETSLDSQSAPDDVQSNRDVETARKETGEDRLEGQGFDESPSTTTNSESDSPEDVRDSFSESGDGGRRTEGSGRVATDDEGTGQRRRRRRRRRRTQDGGSSERRPGVGRSGGNRRRGGGGSQSQSQSQSRDRSRSQRSRSVVQNQNGEMVTGTIDGVLELHPKGYGFLRDPKKNYAAQSSDAFVSSSVIEKNGLREGILIRGEVGPGTRGQGPRLKNIETIDGRTLEEYREVKLFEDLTPVNPFEHIKLERGPRPITMRVMDLLTPIGKGQRTLIVAPPRTGKTMLLQDIADSVSENHPEIYLMVLLIDERPEEVTEMQRRIKGEVIASSMDREVESHVRISQLIFERGKRIAEAGGEVFILLDSITRTARAFNKWVGNTGRTMSGGLDVKALDLPKKMFGTARRFDEGGSLTVAATALIDTGSRMDEVIFQEFKGTGNMELVLSRELADRRIWPAIDIALSGTRREELILSPEVLEGTTLLRRSLVSLRPVEAMEQLIRVLEKFPTNAEFLTKIRDIL